MFFLESISKEDILNQVNKICGNSEFETKKLLCQFLRFVVNETLEGRGDLLKGYTIGIHVLGKDKDFDPEQDSLVRIHAGRLRRLLQVYYLESGKDDPVKIEIPKGKYKPAFSLQELSSRSIEKTDQHKKPVQRDPSVAVIPFKNLTGDPDKAYFAYGFSEELSIELTKYEDLKVINCWQRSEVDAPNLYTQIGAHFLVDGTVQMYDKELRILVKLLDAHSGHQIWAERYNRTTSLNSLSLIQEDIADEVAKNIGSEVGIVLQILLEESRHLKPEKLEVFDAILQFYYYESHMSQEVSIVTFQKLQQALSKDPNSGVIHAMIADMYGNAYALDYPLKDDPINKMDEFVDKAMKLDPYNLNVRIINCFASFLKNDQDRFLREVEHCLARKISSPFRQGILGFHLSLFGEWERGKEILDKTMNKQIGFPSFFYGATCLYYYRQKKYKQAYSEAQKYDMPGLFWGPMLRAACLGKLKRKNEASVDIEELLSLKPDFPKKANYLISRFVKEKDLVDDVRSGLAEAGLTIATER